MVKLSSKWKTKPVGNESINPEYKHFKQYDFNVIFISK